MHVVEDFERRAIPRLSLRDSGQFSGNWRIASLLLLDWPRFRRKRLSWDCRNRSIGCPQRIFRPGASLRIYWRTGLSLAFLQMFFGIVESCFWLQVVVISVC